MTSTDGTKDFLHRGSGLRARMFLIDQKPLRDHARGPVSDQWGPTIVIQHNGGSRRVYECLVCGETHSDPARPLPAEHSRLWWSEHKHGCWEPGRES